MKRESWGSTIGFIFAVAGSAVGLANIWRFPYLVGKNGGAAFIFLYLFCLAVMGFPVFISEMLIGKTAKISPGQAFKKLGGSVFWERIGKMTVLTGFIVSAFYSAVAGWILGYLVEAISGRLHVFETPDASLIHYKGLMTNPYWCVGFHFLFLLFCLLILYSGVRQGIERASKWMMPLLFGVLFLLVAKGLSMPGASKGLSFLFSPDFSVLTPAAIIAAMGQAFFTLSVGQGTLATYGSYLEKNDNLVKNSIPIALMDTVVSILSAVAVFTIVFSVGIEPDSGPGLIFHTLPWVFSQVSGGHVLAFMFFLLVVLAALTSEISALEPAIAYFVDERKWPRKKAVAAVGAGSFLLGIPSALSTSVLSSYTFFGETFLGLMDWVCSTLLIPLGGFFAVILVGWSWGFCLSFEALKVGAESTFKRFPFLKSYFWICFKYTAPALILIVLLSALFFS